jgi:3-oxoacyl-[acyl-carrier-protein] synthase-1
LNKGIAITGMGLISAIGNNVAENYEALISSSTGIAKVKHLETRHANSILVGEVNLTNAQLTSYLKLPSQHNYSRTALLGAYAAKQALNNAGILNISKYKTGLVSATTVGGMDKTEQHYYKFLESKESEKYIDGYHAADTTKKIAEQLNITQSFVTTISTACSSAANAIMLGARLIKAGKLDRVIVGGTDSLSKFTINGFNSLMILSDTFCTPFDDDRKGLNLGEAAAYLVLESDAVVKKESKEVFGYVKGYGNANDAFHQTASSENGDGATLAMLRALKTANLNPSHISYINAHGTATVNNDLSESRAISRVFKDLVPNFSSTKQFTGHTLAAAGAVEAVFSILALQHQVVFPNLNFKTQMQDSTLTPQLNLAFKKLHTVMSNSLGFGGNCTTLIFSKDA